MKIFDVRSGRVEEAIEETARVVFAGGTVVYPDDSGYVFAADPHHEGAAASVREAAEESGTRELALCVASATELLEYAPGNALAAFAVKRLLSERVAYVLLPNALALRVPQSPFTRAILDRCGPLLACGTAYDGTSLEGLPHADLLLERGEVPGGSETTVVDLSGERARLVTEGSVPFDHLAARFGALELSR